MSPRPQATEGQENEGRRARRRRPSGPLLACALLAAMACAQPPWQRGAAEDEGEVRSVARIGDRRISQSELDQRIRNDLFEQYFEHDNGSKLHQVREETLDRMIEEMLLEEAAAGAGTTPDAWLEAQLAALEPVSDAEVGAFFEEHRERLGQEATLELLADRIREFLEQQRRASVLEGLRAQADVEVDLARVRYRVEPSGPSKGPLDAPVTIVVFSDYECPYCLRAEPTIKALLERYPDSLRLVQRHLPLAFHKNARGAALAAVCADAQGRFWEYHDHLFQHQRALAHEQLLGYAGELGLDAPAFERCLADPATAARVEHDIAAAGDLGASGTPSFFINGIPLTGAQPLENFEALIEEELARQRR